MDEPLFLTIEGEDYKVSLSELNDLSFTITLQSSNRKYISIMNAKEVGLFTTKSPSVFYKICQGAFGKKKGFSIGYSYSSFKSLSELKENTSSSNEKDPQKSLIIKITFSPEFDEESEYLFLLVKVDQTFNDNNEYVYVDNSQTSHLMEHISKLETEIAFLKSYLPYVKQIENFSNVILTRFEALHPFNNSLDVPIIKLSGGTLAGTGQYWSWSTISISDDSFFSRVTKNNNNDAITVKADGVYEVIIRTCCACTTNNLYMSLYCNGSEFARCYNSDPSSHYTSYHVQDILELKKDSYLQVYQTYNVGSYNGNPHNVFIVKKIK